MHGSVEGLEEEYSILSSDGDWQRDRVREASARLTETHQAAIPPNRIPRGSRNARYSGILYPGMPGILGYFVTLTASS
eukprot:486740-Amorphochlora_amoeboformis.AAC.2